MKYPLLALELLISTCGACSSPEDVAAVIVGNGGVESDTLEADAASAEIDAAALIVIGQPLGMARWAHPIATWPLSTPLREFFADAAPSSSKRVRVEGPDASALNRLWQAVKRGEYGPPMSAAVARDAAGEEYLLLFQSP